MGAPRRPTFASFDLEVGRALELHKRVVRARRGRVVFVSGSPGSGRSALLDELATALMKGKARTLVLQGSFETGSYVPHSRGKQQPRVSERALDVGQSALALGTSFLPIAAIAGQIMSMSRAAAKLGRELASRPEARTDNPVPKLLRCAAEETPVVVLADDSDKANGSYWLDLVLTFASRLAADLPLIIFLAVEGPPRLPADLGQEQPDAFVVARSLHERRIGEWWHLTPMSRDQMRESIRPSASVAILDSLHRVTDGRRGWLEELWGDWLDRTVVEQRDTDGQWRFAAGYRERALEPVSDLFRERLVHLSGSARPQDLLPLYELLSYAALEGRTFTADAIALAVRRDRDEVIDVLDDVLTSDMDQHIGVVAEAGSVVLPVGGNGARHLWLYRFSSWLDWMTLERWGSFTQDKPRACGRLAEALQVTYGGEVHRVAGAVARLLRTAGEDDGAARFQHLADFGAEDSALRWQAHNIMGADRSSWSRVECRRAAQVMLDAAQSLRLAGPLSEAQDIAACAAELAERAAGRGSLLAAARTLAGQIALRIGELDRAKHHLSAALALWRQVRNRQAENTVLADLAMIAGHEGKYELAQERLNELLNEARRSGDRHAAMNILNNLAGLDLREGHYDRDRAKLTEAIRLSGGVGDAFAEVTFRGNLARLDRDQGNLNQARMEYEDVLNLAGQLGDGYAQLMARYGLAEIALKQQRCEEAQHELVKLLERFKEYGSRRDELRVRHDLAYIDIELGQHDRARRSLTETVRLANELKDARAEIRSHQSLAHLDVKEGHLDDAETTLTKLLQEVLVRAEPSLEASIREALAQVCVSRGDFERARNETRKVLRLWQRLRGSDHELAPELREL